MAEQQQQQPIYLYTTPLRSHKKLGVKKGRDIFGHWAICIEGYCFELAGRTEEEKREGHDRFKINCLPEQQWKDGRELGDEVTAKQVGYTVKYFAPSTIKDIGDRIWAKVLQRKYVFDENNCQVFVRLLVDLIGDGDAQKRLPKFFDKWVRRGGILRDVAVVTFVGAAAITAVGLTVVSAGTAAPVAAAGFGLAANTALRGATGSANLRYGKDKFMAKAQQELREELTAEGIIG
ncbi:hypothetical protein MCOR27_009892 [Pyricularia oryzae]|uniref:LRAT domain-containing protein n=1 Tax=Pyricularia grisea TaxID=148305 RepID=A0ABQ8N7E8_PYRGI|nr:hypothetical protein MCOR01_011146 [Pyricularia oryzae]KAI6292507.1 hypothetical protein MCOR33_009811 [Pyricularia grisea]KAI6252192.1 hypothetical protein MCOR19_011198 [Pyricularia oryzae]KAI6269086.1 hypothetical protein MCOR27_009892 [Pyricularia oryzae]KAI6278109.1 hypothetical protein MCOR26_004825 [Pyricularia oryzae]